MREAGLLTVQLLDTDDEQLQVFMQIQILTTVESTMNIQIWILICKKDICFMWQYKVSLTQKRELAYS